MGNPKSEQLEVLPITRTRTRNLVTGTINNNLITRNTDFDLIRIMTELQNNQTFQENLRSRQEDRFQEDRFQEDRFQEELNPFEDQHLENINTELNILDLENPFSH